MKSLTLDKRHLNAILTLVALSTCDVLIVFLDAGPLRTGAALLLLFFLPGWTILEVVPCAPSRVLERTVLAVGLSYAVTSLGTLYLLYLPGPTTRNHLCITLSVVIAASALMSFLRHSHPQLKRPYFKEILTICAILLLAVGLRVPGIGYSEFCGDEIEATTLSLRAIEGEDFALFTNRKGPVQTLLPIAVWLLSDSMTEATTRLPFLLAGLGGVLTCYVLTESVSRNWIGAAVAATLVSLNGYMIAFSRMAQYQAIVFFLGTLACWCSWQMYKRFNCVYGVFAAILLSVSLLSHFDAVVYLPAILFVGMVAFRHDLPIRERRVVYGIGVALSIGILLSFYVPFMLDPQFAHTVDYLVNERIGTTLLYSNLLAFFQLERVYNSRLYVWLASMFSIAFIIKTTIRRHGDVIRQAPLALGVLSTVCLPDLWTVGDVSLAILPHVALLMFVISGVRENRFGVFYATVLAGVPFLVYLFLLASPRTHFYITAIGRTLLSGLGFTYLLQLRKPPHRNVVLLCVTCMCFAFCAYYKTLMFFPTETRYKALYSSWPARSERVLFGELPAPDSYYTAPDRHGWKAIGHLAERGDLTGDFRTVNSSYKAALWYTRERLQWSRFSDPRIYFVGCPANGEPELPQAISRYGLTHVVYAEGRESIRVYQRDVAQAAVKRCNMEDFVDDYDAGSRLSRYRAGRGEPDMTQVSAYFGDSIVLRGYQSAFTRSALGDCLELELVWRCEAPVDAAYRSFVHLATERVWSQHDDDPANRLPCTLWRVGQTVRGQFRLTFPPDLPPGAYSINVGLYHPATMDRLPIHDEAGGQLGESLTLTTVNVQ